jgi:hypothetical protein
MPKDYFENPICNFHYESRPLWPIYKVLFANLFYYENLFSYCLEMLFWILEILEIDLNSFGVQMKKLWKI